MAYLVDHTDPLDKVFKTDLQERCHLLQPVLVFLGKRIVPIDETSSLGIKTFRIDLDCSEDIA